MFVTWEKGNIFEHLANNNAFQIIDDITESKPRMNRTNRVIIKSTSIVVKVEGFKSAETYYSTNIDLLRAKSLHFHPFVAK